MIPTPQIPYWRFHEHITISIRYPLFWQACLDATTMGKMLCSIGFDSGHICSPISLCDLGLEPSSGSSDSLMSILKSCFSGGVICARRTSLYDLQFFIVIGVPTGIPQRPGVFLSFLFVLTHDRFDCVTSCSHFSDGG